MVRHVAFLRAVNVGGRIVKMDRLRQLFQALRLDRVETFIASGNVIFDAPPGRGGALETAIEEHLATALGYPVGAFVRTLGEVAEISGYEAFAAARVARAHSLHVAFAKTAPTLAVRRRLAALSNPTDELHVRGREVYWLRAGPFSESTIAGPLLERTLGGPATVRNITTVRKIALKYAE